MKRPKTAEQYVDLVKQAMFEVEELRLAAEYDADSMGEVMPFVDKLDRQIRAVYDAMRDGTYRFANEDLEFMELIKDIDDRLLPFKGLLRQINDTHRLGLEVEED